MSLMVIEQLEAAIQAGGVDVLVEVVARDGADDAPRYAQVAVTDEEVEELNLSLKDVQAIHDLTGRVLTAMSPATPLPEPSGGALTEKFAELKGAAPEPSQDSERSGR